VTSLVLLATLASSPNPDATAAALAAYRAGRCGEAQPLLDAALGVDPRNTTLRKLLADCLLREGRPAEARKELERVLATSPEDGDAQKALGAAQRAMQMPEQERQEQLLGSRETAQQRLDSHQRLRRAEGLIAGGRHAEAIALLEPVLGTDPGFLPAAERLAELYSGARRFGAAGRLYAMLFEKEPGRPEWELRAANNLQWDGDAPAAIEAYRSYLALRPRDDAARRALADAMREFGLCHEGLPIYLELAGARPRDAALQLSIALCQDQLGKADLAIEAFMRVLELDPRNAVALAARRQREKDFRELPRRRAYAAIERGDLAAAAEQLELFVSRHPESDDGLRELAEVYAWAERYPEAERSYGEYLRRVPDDDLALRSLARVQSWSGRLPQARASYETLIGWGKARPGDYEGLVNVLLWSGQLEAAEPYAQKLLELEPGSAGALRVLADLGAERALRLREKAEAHEQERRFAEARAAYERYLKAHGPDAQIELRLCDLLSWEGEHARAAAAYRAYLDKRPDDIQARLGLANSLAWAGEPSAAAPQFQAVLDKRPDDAAALLGLAQALEAAGRDPFAVRTAYARAQAADNASDVARRGLAAAQLRLAPALEVDERTFADSDGMRASTLDAGARFVRRGDWTLAPFYRLRLYRQARGLDEESDAAVALNEAQAARNDSFTGQGLGVRAGLGSGTARVLLESGYVWYGEGRGTPFALAEASLGGGRSGSLALAWRHDDAVTEVNRLAALTAGVRVDLVQASADATLARRLRLWGTGGYAWYSSGDAPGYPDAFAANTQYRAQLGSALLLGPARFGYVFRQTGFERRSPLYFSPSRYRVHALQLAADGRLGAFSWGFDAQAGLAQVEQEDNQEWALLATLGYRWSPRMRLVVSGRLSRSSEGLSAQRPYDVQAFTVAIEKLF
jgi:tetratricopeptide (TPR) repeat protein